MGRPRWEPCREPWDQNQNASNICRDCEFFVSLLQSDERAPRRWQDLWGINSGLRSWVHYFADHLLIYLKQAMKAAYPVINPSSRMKILLKVTNMRMMHLTVQYFVDHWHNIYINPSDSIRTWVANLFMQMKTSLSMPSSDFLTWSAMKVDFEGQRKYYYWEFSFVPHRLLQGLDRRH